MNPTQELATVEAWLQAFETHAYAQCHDGLRMTYRNLDDHEIDVLINTARLQVFLYWQTIKNPWAYFRTTLQRAVWKYLRRQQRERQRLAGYVRQWQCHTHLAARTAAAVAAVLEQAPPPQRRLLACFVHGYSDAQVAQALQTTPGAIRQARSVTYAALRSQRS